MIINGYRDMEYHLGDYVGVIANDEELDKIGLDGSYRDENYYVVLIDEKKNKIYLERESDWYEGTTDWCCWVGLNMIERF